MTTAQVLDKIRRLLEEVDTATSVLTDQEILRAVADVRDYYEIALVPDFELLTVESDISEPNYGIQPEASLTLQLGTILAYKAASTLLESTYWGKVNRGEIGSTWASGLESESTLQAARSYEGAIRSLEDTATALILIKRAPVLGDRPL